MRSEVQTELCMSEGKRLLRRSRRNLQDNIKTDRRETGLVDVACIHLAQDTGRCWTLLNTEMNHLIP